MVGDATSFEGRIAERATREPRLTLRGTPSV